MFLTLGSLFDGIGGFPYAATILGITPVWASEIEKAPIQITRLHFPEMVHLGDITKIDGAKISPVDIISFGSPCQDLSIAGKGAGLAGERSGLFMEAVRIIKEMREATHGKYPTFAIWENVPGAFSSNRSADFRQVLEEIARIRQPDAAIPFPPKRKWESAGAVMGAGWSLAWRTLNAQFWGVPQRRRRIFLVADFGGQRAGQIQFDENRLQRYFKARKPPRKGSSEVTAGRPGAAGFNGWRSITGSLEYNEDKSPCIQTKMPPNMVMALDGYNQTIGNVMQSIRSNKSDGDHVGMVIQEINANEKAKGVEAAGFDIQQITSKENRSSIDFAAPQPTLCKAGRPHAIIADNSNAYAVHQNQNGEIQTSKTAYTVGTTSNASGRNTAICMQPIPINDKATRCKGGGDTRNNDGAGNGLGVGRPGDPAPTITAGDKHAVALWPTVASTLTVRHDSSPMPGQLGNICCVSTGQAVAEITEDISPTLNCNHEQPYIAGNMGRRYIVRRLTPRECERLQGFPDDWTLHGVDDAERIIKLADSPRYKAIGNSVAIPCVLFVLSGIVEILRNEVDTDGQSYM